MSQTCEHAQALSAGRTAPALVLLGLGNEILTDDAIGLRIARIAAERLANVPGITVLGSSEMGLALLDLVVGFHTLVVVDAIVTGQARPGFVHELDGGELKSVPAVSPHFLGIGEMLALGQTLGLAVPERVKIFAVEVADPYTLGEKMTPELEAVADALATRLIKSVQTLACSQ
jgi:hydrogenase maturation protease